MNIKHILSIFLPCAFGIVLFACNNAITDIEDEAENKDDIAQVKPLQTGEVRMKAYPDGVNKISFFVVSKKV